MQGFLVPDTKLLPQRLHCYPVVTGWERPGSQRENEGKKGVRKRIINIYKIISCRYARKESDRGLTAYLTPTFLFLSNNVLPRTLMFLCDIIRWRPNSNVRALVNTGSRLLRGAYWEKMASPKWRRFGSGSERKLHENMRITYSLIYIYLIFMANNIKICF